MPTNLYGPGDNFDLENSHVLPALMRRFSEAQSSGAREIVIWGTGTPRREFLHVDDLANAALFLMSNYDEPGLINVGTGTDVTIRELADLIKRVTGYEGTVTFDHTKPDGTPRKLLDVHRIKALGWQPTMSLEDGVAETYRWYLTNRQQAVSAAS
jgi:GDP-L-fucose synthase